MRTMKKSISILLTVLMLAVTVCIPMAVSAESTYTIEKETTLTRFVPAVKAFEAGETKTFEFTADTTAEYALFTMSGGTDRGTTVFAVTEKESGAPVPFTFREKQSVFTTMTTADSYAHAHYAARQYERVGNINEVKVSLTKDTEYVLSLSREAALAQFNYVDLRCLTLPITGGKQEISPADHTRFTSTTTTHLSEQFDYTTRSLSDEYKLIGDYSDASIFSSPHSKVRTYMISTSATATYKLDVQKESYYRVYYTTSTWKSASTITAGSVHTFSVPFAVDGENLNTLVYSYTAPSNGAKLEAQMLTSDVFKMTEGEHTISFGPAGMPGSYAYGIYIEELPDYDPDAIQTVQIEKAPVKVDSAFSRFEFDETLVLSDRSNIYQMQFTPELSGEYAVFLHNETSSSNVLNISAADSEGNEIYNVSRNLKNKSYVRYGDNQYTAIPMEAGETYTITLAGTTNEIRTAYMDLRLVKALPVTGDKFMISPSDYVATTIDASHMSQQFGAIAYKNDAYPIIGNYFSSSLKTPRNSTTTIHHGNETIVSYALDIQESGYYQFTIPEMTVYPSTAKAESVSISVNGAKVETKGWTDAATDIVFSPVFLAEGVNTISFLNETVPYTDADGKEQTGTTVGSYIRAILGEKVAVTETAIDISASNLVDTVIPFAKLTSASGNMVYNESGYYEMYAGASITFKMNVTEAGTYSVYVNGLIPQRGVNIAIDGTDRTSYAYEEKGMKENVTASFYNVHDKKLSYPVALSAGTHSVTLTFKNGYGWKNDAVTLLTDEDNFASKLYKVWVRRTDLVVNETETAYLRAWDFKSANFINEEGKTSISSGWLFPHQFNQGGTTDIGPFTGVRNIVFINSIQATFTVNAPKAGLYTVTSYIGVAAEKENLITLDAVGQRYRKTHIGTGSGDAAVTLENVYLEKGANDIVFRAPATCQGTLRMYAISVTMETAEFVKVKENSAVVSANLEEAYTGTVIVALYNANNALVGYKVDTIENADFYAAEVPTTDTPAKAKVMIWKDIASLSPVGGMVTYTSADENWK